MKLQILILTQRSRAEMLRQLLSLLEPQISALGLRKFDQVDVLLHEDWTGDLRTVGDKREDLRQKATADYICFLDDDDLIAPNYVSSILPLLDGVDQVGFPVKMWLNKKPIANAYLSLQYKSWHSDANGFYRDISHVCPMKRELAMAAPMSGGYGEDARWAQTIRQLGIVQTEHYIPEPMYFYLIRDSKNDAKDAQDPFRLELLEKLRYSPVRG